MATDRSIPAPSCERTEVGSSPGAFRALLVSYANSMQTVDDGPPVLWAKVDESRFCHWLQLPAPRALVRIMLARHISRRVNALRRSAARRASTAEEGLSPVHDLERLEQFERSLPPPTPLAPIAVLVLLPALLLAYLMASSQTQSLLGDLTSATAQIDPGSAVDAFQEAHLQLNEYFQAVIVAAWSLALAMVPFLAAFKVTRRLLRTSSDLEVRGYSSLGCHPANDLELDILVKFLLVVPVGVIGVAIPLIEYQLPPDQRTYAVSWVVGTLVVGMTVLAVIELLGQYATRRKGSRSRQIRFARACLWLGVRASVGFIVLLPFL